MLEKSRQNEKTFRQKETRSSAGLQCLDTKSSSEMDLVYFLVENKIKLFWPEKYLKMTFFCYL